MNRNWKMENNSKMNGKRKMEKNRKRVRKMIRNWKMEKIRKMNRNWKMEARMMNSLMGDRMMKKKSKENSFGLKYHLKYIPSWYRVGTNFEQKNSKQYLLSWRILITLLMKRKKIKTKRWRENSTSNLASNQMTLKKKICWNRK